MNKKRVLYNHEYKFYPATSKVILEPHLNLKQSQILMIVNLSSNTLIYNFACALEGATFSENTLTLVKDVSAMESDDDLMVVVTEVDKTEYYLEKIYNELSSQNKLLIQKLDI